MDILADLSRIFREIFDDEALSVTVETGPDTLEDWDSIAQVKLVLAVEMEYGIRFTTDEVAGIHCVGDFVTLVNRHLGR